MKVVVFVILFGLVFHSFLFAQNQKGLKDYYHDYFPIGVAVNPRMMDAGPESNLILREFNSLTAENVMKMGPIHPKSDVYNWEPADKIVDFAQKHNLKIRGHNLCWHNQTPSWFFVDNSGKQIDKQTLLKRLREHIFAVAGRYKGKIYAWDVVNETISDKPGGVFRQSAFYDIAGEDFIAKAFEYAHEADPDAILFYNDYNTEHPEKREKIYNQLKKLLNAGIPVHGIGLQAHWSLANPSREELEKTITLFSSLGLQVQITELDVSVYSSSTAPQIPVLSGDVEERQLQQYKMVFDVFRKYRKNITGITFWNLSDRSSWLDNFPVKNRKNYPLLFDSQLMPKKAYKEVTKF